MIKPAKTKPAPVRVMGIKSTVGAKAGPRLVAENKKSTISRKASENKKSTGKIQVNGISNGKNAAKAYSNGGIKFSSIANGKATVKVNAKASSSNTNRKSVVGRKPNADPKAKAAENKSKKAIEKTLHDKYRIDGVLKPREYPPFQRTTPSRTPSSDRVTITNVKSMSNPFPPFNKPAVSGVPVKTKATNGYAQVQK